MYNLIITSSTFRIYTLDVLNMLHSVSKIIELKTLRWFRWVTTTTTIAQIWECPGDATATSSNFGDGLGPKPMGHGMERQASWWFWPLKEIWGDWTVTWRDWSNTNWKLPMIHVERDGRFSSYKQSKLLFWHIRNRTTREISINFRLAENGLVFQ